MEGRCYLCWVTETKKGITKIRNMIRSRTERNFGNLIKF